MAHMADRHRGGSLVTQESDFELKTDDEHVQDHAELAQKTEVAERFGPEQETVEFRPQEPEYRRSKDDASDDLADHAGLPDLAQKHAESARNKHDRRDLQQ